MVARHDDSAPPRLHNRHRADPDRHRLRERQRLLHHLDPDRWYRGLLAHVHRAGRAVPARETEQRPLDGDGLGLRSLRRSRHAHCGHHHAHGVLVRYILSILQRLLSVYLTLEKNKDAIVLIIFPLLTHSF